MVKIVYFMTPLSNGGIEKMVISWIEHMNANEVHIDIVPQGIKNEEAKRHLESLGCNIYNMPSGKEILSKKYPLSENYLSRIIMILYMYIQVLHLIFCH